MFNGVLQAAVLSAVREHSRKNCLIIFTHLIIFWRFLHKTRSSRVQLLVLAYSTLGWLVSLHRGHLGLQWGQLVIMSSCVSAKASPLNIVSDSSETHCPCPR